MKFDGRILFLDIDGVLNHYAFVNARMVEVMEMKGGGELDGMPDPAKMFNPVAIERVNRIVEAIGAQIVISSSWRGEPELGDWLLSRGLRGEIIGETPRMPRRSAELPAVRCHEIQQWMDEHDVQPHQVVILDDEEPMEHLAHRLVRTSYYTGILDRHVEKAIALFGPDELQVADDEGER